MVHTKSTDSTIDASVHSNLKIAFTKQEEYSSEKLAEKKELLPPVFRSAPARTTTEGIQEHRWSIHRCDAFDEDED